MWFEVVHRLYKVQFVIRCASQAARMHCHTHACLQLVEAGQEAAEGTQALHQ